MTYFIQLKDGVPFEHPIIEQNLRELFPNIAFPSIFMPRDVEPLGFGIYEYSQQPETGQFERIVELPPVRNPSDGKYYQQWSVVEFTDEEKAIVIAEIKTQIRTQRTMQLYDTDWSQIADNQISDELREKFRVFRQALRDIPNQAGFPMDIVWPEHPQAPSS